MERQTRLLELLVEAQRMEVPRLAALLGVSQVTVRKDLDALASRGLVRREHGMAVLASEDDLSNRLAYHYAAKQRIAALAAADVASGETVMIESGSCCALLAEKLALEKQGVTIVTNSAYIAAFLRGRGTAQVALLGGAYQPESQVMVGPLVRRCAEAYRVDRLFIGMDGFDTAGGFMGRDMMRAEAVRAMAKSAERVAVLTESEKFRRLGVVALLPTQSVGEVYTDAGLDSALGVCLAQAGITIHRTQEEEI